MTETMNLMITYSTQMLTAISTWLSGEPMIYFVAMLLGCFVINLILTIFTLGRRKN